MPDEFGGLIEPYRRELHVHCYRMLGSFDDAEDLVRETFLRARHERAGFADGTAPRARLYRIATNACLDALGRNARRVPALQPYPDRLLDEVAAPDPFLVARQTVELAFLAAIQLLPPRQRAVLILRDVLGWPASGTAAALEMTVPAANSALQRARTTLADLLPDGPDTEPGPVERALLARFIDAHERRDVAAAAALVGDDRRRAVLPPLEQAFGPQSPGDWRLVPTRANRMPTAASYLRAPGDDRYRAVKFDVLRVVDGMIAEITTFDAHLFPAFGLPPALD